MHDYKSWWGPYKRALEKRAMDRPAQWVAATIVFAFVAGVNTICALFGREFITYYSVALAIYAVGTSCIFVALLGFTLIRILRQEKNRTNAPTWP
jgi:drug/metabolite transporter (DMT)-like permease